MHNVKETKSMHYEHFKSFVATFLIKWGGVQV